MANAYSNWVLSENFTFTIDGQLQNGVVKISGIEQEVHVAHSRFGDQQYTAKQPARLEPVKIHIQKYATGTDEIAKWRSLVKDTGEPQRCSMAIGLLDRQNKPVGEFRLQNAMPVAWKLYPLSSNRSGHAVEELTIIAERFDYSPG
jgi:phage tail-like protein